MKLSAEFSAWWNEIPTHDFFVLIYIKVCSIHPMEPAEWGSKVWRERGGASSQLATGTAISAFKWTVFERYFFWRTAWPLSRWSQSCQSLPGVAMLNNEYLLKYAPILILRGPKCFYAIAFLAKPFLNCRASCLYFCCHFESVRSPHWPLWFKMESVVSALVVDGDQH